MGMLGTVVYMDVLDDATAETVLGEHALEHFGVKRVITGLYVLVERLLQKKLGSRYALSAGITGVAEIFAVGPLVAGEAHLVGVDDDNMIATLYKGRVSGFVLASQNVGYNRTEASEHLVGSVDDYPLAVAALIVGSKSFVT